MIPATELLDRYRRAAEAGDPSLPTSRDPLVDQLDVLGRVARRLGLDEAADWIREALDWDAP